MSVKIGEYLIPNGAWKLIEEALMKFGEEQLLRLEKDLHEVVDQAFDNGDLVMRESFASSAFFYLRRYVDVQENVRQGISPKVRRWVFERDGYRCRLCGNGPPEKALQVDHVIPVTRGGSDDIGNLQTLCRECNVAKSNTMPGVDGQD